VNAAHDKALAELAEQQRLVEAAKADYQRHAAVNEDLSAKGAARLAALVERCDAKQKEIDAQMALHDNIVASLGSLKAKVDAGLQEKLN
jgi:hypothetical protein